MSGAAADPAPYDLVIVGSGSGNSLITDDFAGKRVAIVEHGTFGGTCLNVGCIPTKMFVYAAEVATAVRESSRYGIDARLERVRWPDIRDRIFGRIDPISAAGLQYRLHGPGTTAYLGHARFVADRELEIDITGPSAGRSVGERARISGDQVVIATGSRAWVPAVVAASGVPYETSDTIMRIDALPERLLVLGGGFIGAEFAHVFSALGVQVAIATRGERLLSHLDEEISERFTALARQQWQVHTGANVTGARRLGDGVALNLADGTTMSGDLLLVATGRMPNSDDLGLNRTNVRTRQDGRVVVDEHGRTDAEGTWAMGDVSAPYQLKHLANHEARVLAYNLVHPDGLRSFDHRGVPSAVFTHPQIATVGLTEQQAREAGHQVSVKVQAYGDTAYGWAMEDTTSICKVVVDSSTGLLLGAHLMGPQASSLIQPLIQAMAFGQRAGDVARRQFWIHPAMAEVVENALLGVDAPGNVR